MGGTLMARSFVLRVGPLGDGSSVYVPVGENAPSGLDPVEAADDDAGLRGILGQNPSSEIVCSPELARSAAAHGLRVEAPPAFLEGMRVRIGIQFAQTDEFDHITSSWAHLFLMRSVQKLVDSETIDIWPVGRAFDVQLSGDRTERWAGWITPGAEPVVTLVHSRADADELAKAKTIDRRARLDSLDHVAVRLVSAPPYVLGPMRALYGAEQMPWFDIREGGARRMASDEDAFVIASVMEALATIKRSNEIGDVESISPRRTVRTLVGAVLDAPGSRVD